MNQYVKILLSLASSLNLTSQYTGPTQLVSPDSIGHLRGLHAKVESKSFLVMMTFHFAVEAVNCSLNTIKCFQEHQEGRSLCS